MIKSSRQLTYHGGFNTILFLIYRASSALVSPPKHHQLPINIPIIHDIQSSISEIKILSMELPVTIQNSSNRCKPLTKDLMHCLGRIATMQQAGSITSIMVNMEWTRLIHISPPLIFPPCLLIWWQLSWVTSRLSSNISCESWKSDMISRDLLT